MSSPTYNWQQKGWPRFTYNRAHLSDEQSIHPFEDGEEGVRSGLSAAKWMRMTKVSKPTATRELSALIAEGKIEHRGSKKTGGYYIKQ